MIMDHGTIAAEGTPRELKRRVAGDSVVTGLRDEKVAERAVLLLRQEPYVREINSEPSRLQLYVEDGGSAIPQLLRLLDRESLELKSISLSEPTLDDVFLRQTGRSLRDAASTSEEAA
jgi:ABC-2 type transport system ATP-binding protein